MHETLELVHKEAEILECSEESEIDRHGQPQPPLSFLPGTVKQFEGDEVVYNCGSEYQRKETPIPAAVEHVGRNEEHPILHPHAIVANQPVEPDHNGEERPELIAIEQHLLL